MCDACRGVYQQRKLTQEVMPRAASTVRMTSTVTRSTFTQVLFRQSLEEVVDVDEEVVDVDEEVSDEEVVDEEGLSVLEEREEVSVSEEPDAVSVSAVSELVERVTLLSADDERSVDDELSDAALSSPFALSAAVRVAGLSDVFSPTGWSVRLDARSRNSFRVMVLCG